MLQVLQSTLVLTRSFDACIWAMALCAFWGLMCFREVAVTTWGAFNPAQHLTRGDVFSGKNQDGKPYARLDLPAAKTAKPGDVQSVFLVQQGDLCPLEALRILAAMVPTGVADPLFSWRDNKGIC